MGPPANSQHRNISYGSKRLTFFNSRGFAHTMPSELPSELSSLARMLLLPGRRLWFPLTLGCRTPQEFPALKTPRGHRPFPPRNHTPTPSCQLHSELCDSGALLLAPSAVPDVRPLLSKHVLNCEKSGGSRLGLVWQPRLLSRGSTHRNVELDGLALLET